MRDAAHEIRRQGVLAFIQRAMFCQIKGCEQCLDIDSAVLITSILDNSSAVVCGESWARIGPNLTAQQVPGLLEIWRGSDGAELQSVADGGTWT